MSTLRRWRLAVQILTLGLLFLIPWLNRRGIMVAFGNLYAWGTGPLTVADPVVALQSLLGRARVYGSLLVAAVIPLGLALAFGKAFCGWMCPMNTLIEAVNWLGRSAPRRWRLQPRRVPGAGPWALRVAIGVLLVTIGVAWGVGVPLAAYLSAPGLISLSTTSIVFFGAVGAEGLLILAILTVEFFWVERVWCTYICPTGTLLGLFRMPWTLRPRLRPGLATACPECGACERICPFGLDPVNNRLGLACTNCGDCVSRCGDIRGVLRMAIGPALPSTRKGRESKHQKEERAEV